MLGPVDPFLLAGGWQIKQVANERAGLGARRERASCSLRVCLGRAGEKEVFDEEEPEATDENVGDEKKRGHREGKGGTRTGARARRWHEGLWWKEGEEGCRRQLSEGKYK